MAADWVAISSLATAGGTLVLAVATFGSVRSANRAARVAEESLLAGIRPVLVASRPEDPPEKVSFSDNHFVRVHGGRGIAEATDDAIYLAIALRNVGSGLAVLDRWDFYPERQKGGDATHRAPESFHRLTRDLYVPAGYLGFWQGVFREPTDPDFAVARAAIEQRQDLTVDLVYSDHEGGQRTITRFALIPKGESEWMAIVARHWNLDRDDPR